MNTTPRVLNRVVLAVVGILAVAAGAFGLALLASPDVASRWGVMSARLGERIASLRSRTTLEGQADSWLWIALATALVVAIVLLVVWIAAQGRGRTGRFAPADRGRRAAAPSGHEDDGGVPGTVTITAAAVEQALKTALLERSDLAGASVSTWEIRGVPALRVRVFPRKGMPPYALAEDVSRLVEAVDAVAGHRAPVLISITSGARVRFTRSERVD